MYKLEEENHDVTDRKKALEKAFEWGEKIPIGIFYIKEKSTYRDNLPHVKDTRLKVPTKNVDITSTLFEMM